MLEGVARIFFDQPFGVLFGKIELCGKVGEFYVPCVVQLQILLYNEGIVGDLFRLDLVGGEYIAEYQREKCGGFCVVSRLFSGGYLLEKFGQSILRQRDLDGFLQG